MIKFEYGTDGAIATINWGTDVYKYHSVPVSHPLPVSPENAVICLERMLTSFRKDLDASQKPLGARTEV